MVFAAAYLVGVLIALVVMRDPWPRRIATALVWPLGPVAFVVVIIVLLAASVVLWPVRVVTTAALAGALGWWLT